MNYKAEARATNIKQRDKQIGSAAIEFPFIVISTIVLLLGFINIYRIMYSQARIDSVAFTLASAVAVTLEDSKELAEQINGSKAQELRSLAKLMLPEDSRIGIVLEVHRKSDIPAKDAPVSVASGENCQVETSISNLKKFERASKELSPALTGRVPTLIQVTLCIERPFISNLAFPGSQHFTLPTSLDARALIIGRSYES